MNLKQFYSKNKVIILISAGVLGFFVLIFLSIIGSILIVSNSLNYEDTSEKFPEEIFKTSPSENKITTLPTSSIQRIEKIVGDVGRYEVIVFDSSGNFATEDSIPYEIIVNGGFSQFNNCFQAKEELYEVMKNLYSDEMLKGKISRVLFTAPNYLRASAGYEDVKDFTWDYGISNYWKVTLQYKNYEDESGTLSKRTWGKQIDSTCD